MEKRMRGRPAVSKNKKPVDKRATHITIPMVNGKRQYKYTFRSNKCKCEFESDIKGCGMYCRHKHEMDIITENF
jgi:hypothetical protein